MSLIEYVFEKIDPKLYYAKRYEGWNGNPNSNVPCPFLNLHSGGTDNKPSFSVGIGEQGGCYCHSCGTKIANIIHHEKLSTKEEDDERAASAIYNEFVRPVLSPSSNVESYLAPFKENLRRAPRILASIKNDLQISQTTIDRFNLGYDPTKRRITIPIFDTFGQLINIRLYSLPSMREDGKYPKIINTDGYGKPASCFPQSTLSSLCSSKHKPNISYWFTGERDTLLAWDRGIPSFCYTVGELVCKDEWAEEISKLRTIIAVVADNDKAGREGAAKRCAFLELKGIPYFLVEFDEPDVKDFSDYIIKEKGTIADFLQKKKDSIPEPSEEEIPEENYIPKIYNPLKYEIKGEYSVSSIGRNSTLLNSRILVKAIVSGKTDRTYSIPRIVCVNGTEHVLPISREMIQLVREGDDKVMKHFAEWLQTKSPITVVERITISDVEIIPMIQPGFESLYVNQRCYFVGEEIECNKPYMMEVIPTTEMKSQESVGIIVSIKPISNILDSFEFTEESYRRLRHHFGPNPRISEYANLRDLAHSISLSYTGIYNRDDLHIVSLLTWLSPLQFEFPHEGMQRGWLNSLILGDTETGKSKVCQKLTSLFSCGVFINAENCSYVGLVGGAIKSSTGMFILRWGKIPLYNRQLVVIEELSGMGTIEISHMSDIRSAGIARYDKGGLTGETSAKTRLLCLSNVRGAGKSLGDYSAGVLAAQNLIGQNEDLARFDLILTVTDDEVNSDIINEDRSTKKEELFSEDELKAFKELAMFAWSLKPEQIYFSTEAYRACLSETLRMSKEYHTSIPIFKAGSGRLKLARIALSIACIQFSWDGAKLVVGPKHVHAAAKVLEQTYKKPSFGYLRYSKIQYDMQKVEKSEQVVAKVKELLNGNEQALYSYIGNCATFTKYDLSEAMGKHHMYMERIISAMYLSNLLKKGDMRSEWKLSIAGRKWIDAKLNQN